MTLKLRLADVGNSVKSKERKIDGLAMHAANVPAKFLENPAQFL
jgi:hypothetical protein